MKFIFFALFALVLQCVYGDITEREKKFFGRIFNKQCLIHNAKCLLYLAGAVTYCNAWNIVSKKDCKNEYDAIGELCIQNKKKCDW